MTKDLKIIEPDSMKFNGKELKIGTNLGEVKISYGDAFEIMWTLLDATVGISQDTQKLLERIDKEYCLDKF